MKYFRHYFLLARRINQEFLFNQIISDSIRNRKTWGYNPYPAGQNIFINEDSLNLSKHLSEAVWKLSPRQMEAVYLKCIKKYVYSAAR